MLMNDFDQRNGYGASIIIPEVLKTAEWPKLEHLLIDAPPENQVTMEWITKLTSLTCLELPWRHDASKLALLYLPLRHQLPKLQALRIGGLTCPADYYPLTYQTARDHALSLIEAECQELKLAGVERAKRFETCHSPFDYLPHMGLGSIFGPSKHSWGEAGGWLWL